MLCRMQPSTNEESSATETVNRVRPTEEQEAYAQGFTVALNRIYAQRGTPAAVRIRSPSTQPAAFDPATPSNCTLQRPAARLSGSSDAGTAVSSSVVLPSMPVAVTDLMLSANSDVTTANADIPLCVARMAATDSFDQHQLSDEEQQPQPENSLHSTGMNKTQWRICNLGKGGQPFIRSETQMTYFAHMCPLYRRDFCV